MGFALPRVMKSSSSGPLSLCVLVFMWLNGSRSVKITTSASWLVHGRAGKFGLFVHIFQKYSRISIVDSDVVSAIEICTELFITIGPTSILQFRQADRVRSLIDLSSNMYDPCLT